MKLFAHALKEELKDCFLSVLDSLANSLSLQIQGDTLKVLVIEKTGYFSSTENSCDIFQEFILQDENKKQSVRISNIHQLEMDEAAFFFSHYRSSVKNNMIGHRSYTHNLRSCEI